MLNISESVSQIAEAIAGNTKKGIAGVIRGCTAIHKTTEPNGPDDRTPNSAAMPVPKKHTKTAVLGRYYGKCA